MAKILTPKQAARAIYFDFEGCVHEAPSLLGWSFVRDDGTERFGQDIVASPLWEATRKVPHTSGKVLCGRSTLRTAVNCLVLLAEGQDRQIVSWAHHDMEMIERYVDDPKLVERAQYLYMNALPTARQWLRKVRPGEVLDKTWGGKHKLAVYCELMGRSVPKKYGRDVAAKGIRTTRAAIARCGSYANVPVDSSAREAWMAVLGHNRLDCSNAREIVTRAAAEYAAA